MVKNYSLPPGPQKMVIIRYARPYLNSYMNGPGY